MSSKDTPGTEGRSKSKRAPTLVGTTGFFSKADYLFDEKPSTSSGKPPDDDTKTYLQFHTALIKNLDRADIETLASVHNTLLQEMIAIDEARVAHRDSVPEASRLAELKRTLALASKALDVVGTFEKVDKGNRHTVSRVQQLKRAYDAMNKAKRDYQVTVNRVGRVRAHDIFKSSTTLIKRGAEVLAYYGDQAKHNRTSKKRSAVTKFKSELTSKLKEFIEINGINEGTHTRSTSCPYSPCPLSPPPHPITHRTRGH